MSIIKRLNAIVPRYSNPRLFQDEYNRVPIKLSTNKNIIAPTKKAFLCVNKIINKTI